MLTIPCSYFIAARKIAMCDHTIATSNAKQYRFPSIFPDVRRQEWSQLVATLSLAIVLLKMQGDNKMTDKREVEETISHVCIQRMQANLKYFRQRNWRSQYLTLYTLQNRFCHTFQWRKPVYVAILHGPSHLSNSVTIGKLSTSISAYFCWLS